MDLSSFAWRRDSHEPSRLGELPCSELDQCLTSLFRRRHVDRLQASALAIRLPHRLRPTASVSTRWSRLRRHRSAAGRARGSTDRPARATATARIQGRRGQAADDPPADRRGEPALRRCAQPCPRRSAAQASSRGRRAPRPRRQTRRPHPRVRASRCCSRSASTSSVVRVRPASRSEIPRSIAAATWFS